MKKEDKRTYKIDTGKVASVRLGSAKPVPEDPRGQPMENARELIIKLIEAIKRL